MRPVCPVPCIAPPFPKLPQAPRYVQSVRIRIPYRCTVRKRTASVPIKSRKPVQPIAQGRMHRLPLFSLCAAEPVQPVAQGWETPCTRECSPLPPELSPRTNPPDYSRRQARLRPYRYRLRQLIRRNRCPTSRTPIPGRPVRSTIPRSAGLHSNRCAATLAAPACRNRPPSASGKAIPPSAGSTATAAPSVTGGPPLPPPGATANNIGAAPAGECGTRTRSLM